jgi:hypothetical protein
MKGCQEPIHRFSARFLIPFSTPGASKRCQEPFTDFSADNRFLTPFSTFFCPSEMGRVW